MTFFYLFPFQPISSCLWAQKKRGAVTDHAPHTTCRQSSSEERYNNSTFFDYYALLDIPCPLSVPEIYWTMSRADLRLVILFRQLWSIFPDRQRNRNQKEQCSHKRCGANRKKTS